MFKTVIPILWSSINAQYAFEGRWEHVQNRHSEYSQADWPCSAVSFQLKAGPDSQVTLKWEGIRTLVLLSVEDNSGSLLFQKTLVGKEYTVPWHLDDSEKVEIDFGAFMQQQLDVKVSLRKLTEA